jgi:hypothetical protein
LVAAYDPGAQVKHAPPMPPEKVPTKHATHSTIEIEPLVAVALPAAQIVQELEAAADDQLPIAHASHEVEVVAA